MHQINCFSNVKFVFHDILPGSSASAKNELRSLTLASNQPEANKDCRYIPEEVVDTES
jgi:hypothetical protein